MPFKKIISGKNKGKFKSPTGKVFTEKQVNLYYANKKSFPKKKKRRV